jgi:PKD repeat protein
MLVMLSIVSSSFVALTMALSGAMSAHASARWRSAFNGIANAEIETMRALPYDDLGVLQTDPDFAAAYPSGRFEEGDAAVVTSSSAPRVVTVVTSAAGGLPTPYTIRRWVTWSPTAGVQGFKRIIVRVEWPERRSTATVRLQSSRYPGGQGTAVGGSNQPPSAALAISAPSPTYVGSQVTFDGRGSSDPDADPLVYEWDFGDGSPRLTGPATTPHAYTSAGLFAVQLTVSDGRGASATAIDSVTVLAQGLLNLPPEASFTLSPSTGVGPLTVNFDAGASLDPNGSGDIAAYTWNWGDGSPPGRGINASHVFTVISAPVTYVVELVVTDNAGATGRTTRTVTVSPLNCSVADGWFRNAETNPTKNDVLVGPGNKPVSNSFTFFATTNSACTTVTGRLTHSAGTLVVTLDLQSEVAGVKAWKGTGTVGTAVRFNTGSNQTGEIRAPSATGEHTFTFPFGVH